MKKKKKKREVLSLNPEKQKLSYGNKIEQTEDTATEANLSMLQEGLGVISKWKKNSWLDFPLLFLAFFLLNCVKTKHTFCSFNRMTRKRKAGVLTCPNPLSQISDKL